MHGGSFLLAQVPQRGCGFPVPANTQGQAGCDSEPPQRVLDSITSKDPFQSKLFYNSLIL